MSPRVKAFPLLDRRRERRVVLVGERCPALRLEVDAAHLAARQLVPVIVEDLDLHAGHRTADRSRLLQPAVGLGDGGRALHAAVGLPDDRAPPVHHLLLHLERARSGRVDDDLEARDVVRVLDLLGQTEEPDELGRHHVGRRDTVPLDGSQRLLGVELAQDRERPGRHSAPPGRSSGSRRGASRPTPGGRPSSGWNWKAWPKLLASRRPPTGRSCAGPAGPPPSAAPSCPRSRRSGCPAGGPAGSVRGLALDERLLGQEALDVAADRDPELDRPGARHLLHPVGEVAVKDESRRFRVIDDALDLGPRERRVQGDGLEPAFVRGQLPAEHVDVVRQGIGEDVAGTEALGRAVREPADGRVPPAPKRSG